MVAMNHRIVHTVINRCKMPADGDILVPAHTVAVIGTTDVKVPDPDHFGIEPWEVRLMLARRRKNYPGFQTVAHATRLGRCAPALPGNGQPHKTGDVTRAFVLLDHAAARSGRWHGHHHQRKVDHLPQDG